jgi:hypothetical protein
MKTRFLKLVLPAFAILLAVGLAFATESNTVSQVAYYQTPSGVMEVTIGEDCTINGDISCTYFGYQLYAEPTLITELGRNP